MILLKLGLYFFFVGFVFTILEKISFSTWDFYDLLLFCFLGLIGFQILEEKISYFILLLLAFGMVLSFLVLKEFLNLFCVFKRKSTIVIRNGVLNFKELTKLSYSFEKLMEDLEKMGIQSVDEVGFAVLKGKRLLCIKK